MLTAAGNTIRKLDLRGTCLCGTPQDVTTGYTLVGVETLCEALTHSNCQLLEIDLSENGVRAEAEEAAPSALPPVLYRISKLEVQKLAALHSDVRIGVLRLLDYPNLFREVAQRKGLTLPSLETLSRMPASEMSLVWEQALQAEATFDTSLTLAAEAPPLAAAPYGTSPAGAPRSAVDVSAEGGSAEGGSPGEAAIVLGPRALGALSMAPVALEPAGWLEQELELGL